MYSYSLFANYILVSENSIDRPKFFGHICTRKIKNLIWRHFCSPKKWEKTKFFWTKTSFLSDLKQAATVFSILLWHLRNILLSYDLIEFVRVCTRCTSTLGVDHFKVYELGVFDVAVSGSEIKSLYLAWSIYVIKPSRSYQGRSSGTYSGT